MTSRDLIPPTLAAARAERALAALIVTAATRMVRIWGLVRLWSLVQRVRVLARTMVTHASAGAVLAALPRTLWLDVDQEWFSFPDPRSRLQIAVGKVFSITHRAPFEELRRVLAKASPETKDAPAEVVRRYLVDVAACAIEPEPGPAPADPTVRPTPATPRHRPTRRELALVRLLNTDEPGLDLETLRRRARAAALPRTTVNQLLESSPLFLTDNRVRIRLIGDGQLAVYA